MKERVLTAIVLLAVVVGALFFDPNGWAVKVLILLVTGACGFELSKLLSTPWSSFVPLFGVASIIFPRHPAFVAHESLSNIVLAICAGIAAPLIIFSVLKKSDFAKGFFAVFWIAASVDCIYFLATAKSPSAWPLLMTAAIPIWCGDTAAIFVGKAFGKHKMAPSISPNKTWEGGIGNLLACVGAALALGAIFHYPLVLMVLLGLNCGILGQAGDLFESWLKRKADVKDSGNILPGHGGLLDRLDSLMATAPFSLLILQSLVIPGKP